MRPLTREWVQKAEGDFVSALREYRARKMPNYNAACFHAQQCAEKYMKACLQERDTPFEKTHDLVRLLHLLPENAVLEALETELSVLSAAAVEFRYPGEQATKKLAKEAIDTCRVVRTEIRGLLRLLTE